MYLQRMASSPIECRAKTLWQKQVWQLCLIAVLWPPDFNVPCKVSFTINAKSVARITEIFSWKTNRKNFPAGFDVFFWNMATFPLKKGAYKIGFIFKSENRIACFLCLYHCLSFIFLVQYLISTNLLWQSGSFLFFFLEYLLYYKLLFYCFHQLFLWNQRFFKSSVFSNKFNTLSKPQSLFIFSPFSFASSEYMHWELVNCLLV